MSKATRKKFYRRNQSSKKTSAKAKRAKTQREQHYKVWVPISKFDPSPEDLEIAIGTRENTPRLVEIASMNVPSLYESLLFNPLLDPESRFKVVNNILNASKSAISNRRKYDFLTKSSQIHYYPQKYVNMIKEELALLHETLIKEVIDVLKVRTMQLINDDNELERVTDHEIELIKKFRLFPIKESDKVNINYFWWAAKNCVKAIQFEGEGPTKHQNDITYSKANASIATTHLENMNLPKKLIDYSLPAYISCLYLAPYYHNGTREELVNFALNLLEFTEKFPALRVEAREELRLYLLAQEELAAKRERDRAIEIERQAEILRIQEETRKNYGAQHGYRLNGTPEKSWDGNNSRHRPWIE